MSTKKTGSNGGRVCSTSTFKFSLVSIIYGITYSNLPKCATLESKRRCRQTVWSNGTWHPIEGRQLYREHRIIFAFCYLRFLLRMFSRTLVQEPFISSKSIVSRKFVKRKNILTLKQNYVHNESTTPIPLPWTTLYFSVLLGFWLAPRTWEAPRSTSLWRWANESRIQKQERSHPYYLLEINPQERWFPSALGIVVASDLLSCPPSPTLPLVPS